MVLKSKISILIVFFILLSVPYCRAQLLNPAQLDTTPVFTDLSLALKNKDIVYRLDLSKQKLKEVPEEIFQFKNLNELRLDKNKLQDIPEEILQFNYLQVFSCKHNEIDTIPESYYKLKNLRVLDVSDNLIERISDNIQNLQNLEMLALWDNPIAYYPESMSELHKLQVLDLLHNQINKETQARIKLELPKCKVIMSPPCACRDGGE